eukprot:Skav228551  [mRNA]  locus=scaffold1887:593027:593775:+ [translate_table: standard]
MIIDEPMAIGKIGNRWVLDLATIDSISDNHSLQIEFISKLDFICHVWHVLSTIAFTSHPQRIPLVRGMHGKERLKSRVEILTHFLL